MVPPQKPPINLSPLETKLLASGVRWLAGVDEVGRGCLAGPVVAACVIFPQEGECPPGADSKQLTPKVREQLFDAICAQALAWSVAAVPAAEIDRLNIHQASLLAMKRAIKRMSPRPDYLLVDGKFPVDVAIAQQAIVNGDVCCRTIGAASIIAKVWRDRFMLQMQQVYPTFSFAQHKGYGTRQHRAELLTHGPTQIHRRSFKGVS